MDQDKDRMEPEAATEEDETAPPGLAPADPRPEAGMTCDRILRQTNQAFRIFIVCALLVCILVLLAIFWRWKL